MYGAIAPTKTCKYVHGSSHAYVSYMCELNTPSHDFIMPSLYGPSSTNIHVMPEIPLKGLIAYTHSIVHSPMPYFMKTNHDSHSCDRENIVSRTFIRVSLSTQVGHTIPTPVGYSMYKVPSPLMVSRNTMCTLALMCA
jgi:hypothetical protein